MKKLNLIIMSAAAAFAAHAADPALTLAGSGSETDPYIVSTKADVLQLAAACNNATVANAGHYAGKYFRLTADIDLENDSTFLGIGTAPEGVASAATYGFQGIFDGQGHRILNMSIDGVAYDAAGKAITKWGVGQSRQFIGFFGRLNDGAQVRNLIIDGSCTVKAVKAVGGVAGYVAGGATVENCVNFGKVISYYQTSGGIAGEVVTTASGKPATVRNCFNAGEVVCNHSMAGGITGLATFGTISGCANTGKISGHQINEAAGTLVQVKIGGIVGSMGGTALTDCFNAGDIWAAKGEAGGIAGNATKSSGKGEIMFALNVGAVDSYTKTNGNILGSTGTAATTKLDEIDACYYDSQMLNSNFLASGAGATPAAGVYTLTTAELTSGTLPADLNGTWKAEKGFYPLPATLDYAELRDAAATYILLPENENANFFRGTATISNAVAGISASFAEADGCFEITGNSIKANPGDTIATAVLTLNKGSYSRSLPLTTFAIPFKGTGSEADPYVIANADDIMALASICNEARYHWNGDRFKMTADIDMSAAKEFKGIGSGADLLSNTNPQKNFHFDGIFDADGHKISNLDLNTVKFNEAGDALPYTAGSYHNTGFFGSLGQGAEIRNLTLDETCKISGIGCMGGIAGALAGSAVIDNCHVGAKITSYSRYCGGIFGYNIEYPLTISNSTFFGSIHSNWDYVGGIASWNNHTDAKIVNCVNTGSITIDRFNGLVAAKEPVNRAGGIAAVNTGTIEDCANFGPIMIDVDQTSSDINSIGGICGQTTNSTGVSSVNRTFNAGQILVKGGAKQTNISSLIGWRYFKNGNPQGDFDANYCDTTLNAVVTLLGTTTGTNDYVSPDSATVAMTTAALTGGKAIEKLAGTFTFEKGYYPMPKALAENANVRTAAATYLVIPENQSIRTIYAGGFYPFNNMTEITGSLDSDKGFEIKDNGLLALASETDADNMLRLSAGNYFNIYPIHSVYHESDGTETLEYDEIVSQEFMTLDGLRLENPAPGQIAIVITTTASGHKSVRKAILR